MVLFAKFSLIFHKLPQVLDGPGDDAVSFVRLENFLVKFFFNSGHGIGLSATGLSVGEDGD